MSNRHKAAPAAVPRHARFRRTRQLPWILLGMLFVAAALLSSPRLGGAEPSGPAPTRDLGVVSHSP
jgi:hypothetical protein